MASGHGHPEGKGLFSPPGTASAPIASRARSIIQRKYNTIKGLQSKKCAFVDKSYFYSNPDLLSKPRKGYVTKGDMVEILFETVNFVSAYFTNKQGKATMGFLLKKGLKLIHNQ